MCHTIMRVLLVFLCLTSAYAEAPRRVILLVVDSIRADHTGYSGYERATTPGLDKIAAEGVVFSRAIASSHVTIRSVPGYMSGFFASRLYKNPMADKLVPESYVMLAQAFQTAGYTCQGWTTNGEAGAAYGFDRGFETYHELYPRGEVKASMDELVRLVKDTYKPQADRPEFLYFHTMDVHYPYRPPAPYDRMFTKRYTRNVVKEGVLRDVHDRYATSNLPYFSQVHDVTQEDIDFVKGLYDGAIRYTDDKMSELLAVLQYDPAKDLLVYTADHGEQFFEHGFWGHGRHGYPEEINVPLVMRWDGLTPRTINQPVSLLDLYPTFAELCGFAAPEGHDGESLASLLTGGPEKPRAVASESADWRGPVVTLIGPKFLYLLSTRTKSIYPWKVWPDDEELYDLQTDPRCQKNLLGSSTFEIADDMNRLMRGMLPRYGNFHPNNIRGDEETLTWGGNLFTATEENLQSWTYGALAETTRTEDNSVSFTVNAPEMSVAGPTEFFTTLYVVDVKYTLSSGVMELVVESEDGTVLWDYEIRKPAESWQSLRGAFYPRSGTTRLVVRMTEPGSAQLGWPIMRKPEVPFINLAQWEPMDKQPAAARWKPRDKKPAAEEEPAAVVEPEPEPEPDPNTVVFEQIMPPADTAPAPEPEVMENVQPADTPDQVEEGGEADTTEEPELTDEQKMRLEALGYT